MNKNLLALAAVVLTGLVLFSGCEADRTRLPGVGLGRGAVALPAREHPLNEAKTLARAAAEPAAPIGGAGWTTMFDGQTLAGWSVTPFNRSGQVECRDGLVILGKGDPFTGIRWTNEVRRINYEVVLEAMRVAGDDLFCGLVIPVRDSFCSLLVGGWGGGLVGLSCLDGVEAPENETAQFVSFETGRWYRIRLRVTEQKIEAWVEQKKVVNLVITGRKLSLGQSVLELSRPFGIVSRSTTAALRGIQLRPVSVPADSER